LTARKVTIEVRKQGGSGPGTYCLRSTFPAKPGSGRLRPFRQRLYTGLAATPNNKQRIRALARRVEAALLEGSFNWAEFDAVPAEEPETGGPLTIQTLLPGFRAHLEGTRGISEHTWQRNYLSRLKVRPGLAAELTPVTLEQALRATPKASHARRADFMALRVLAGFAGVEFDFGPWASSYSPSSVQPIDIPTDAQIVTLVEGTTNPGHRWLLGAIATWGLRPHEAWLLTVVGGSTRAEVHDRTKTGRRLVPAMPREWVERWQLDQPVRPAWAIPPDDTASAVVTDRIDSVLRRRDFGFRTYSLRHAWAIRAFKLGIPTGTAAKCMGHSDAVHQRSYSRWIGEEAVLEAFEGFT
jgi:integrase